MDGLAKFVAQRRNELRLTQQEVSERLAGLGIQRKPTTISGWENGNDPVPLEFIPALAEVLELPSPNILYDHASILSHIRGGSVARLLGDKSDFDIARIERMVRAYFDTDEARAGTGDPQL